MLRVITLISLMFSPAAMAAPGEFRPDKIVYCSDGEFDWDSGQSLYDFVILKKDNGDFLISYLSIPHPSYEQRNYDHPWIKIKGKFSVERLNEESRKGYRLLLDIEGQEPRRGDLVIAADDSYSYTITPPMPFSTTKSGLCWDSLEPDPTDRLVEPRR
jgi:hypothetical protein